MMIRPEVRKGEALLNEGIPDWRDEINTDELRMSNGLDCILGQLVAAGRFNDLLDGDAYYYWRLIDRLDIDGVDHGFSIGDTDDESEWERLGAEWIEVIKGH